MLSPAPAGACGSSTRIDDDDLGGAGVEEPAGGGVRFAGHLFERELEVLRFVQASPGSADRTGYAFGINGDDVFHRAGILR
jgi:hypothetical protein